jgi:hypothetical protein
MINFVTPLDCRALLDGENWELLRDLVVDVGQPGGKDHIRIKKGFVTDFGSVPGFLQFFVSPQGKSKPAYVLHDWLYRNQPYNQLVCDGLLVDAMECLGVGWLQRNLVYRGLRLGGFVTYNRYTKKLKEQLNETRIQDN